MISASTEVGALGGAGGGRQGIEGGRIDREKKDKRLAVQEKSFCHDKIVGLGRVEASAGCGQMGSSARL
jgi:hypothetical protein